VRKGKKGKMIDIGPMRVCNDGSRYVVNEKPEVETSVIEK
jgi:hypothetical protein